MHNLRLLPAVLTLSIAASSCWFRKSPDVFTPPPPQAQPRPATVEASAPPILPAPPNLAADLSVSPPPLPAAIPDIPAPPKPKPTSRRPVAVAAPKPLPPPDQPAPPKLGQVFTDNEKREYNRQLDESLERIRKNMAKLAARNLSTEQHKVVVQIEEFEKQAEQAREQDLVTAVSLASRADQLATDLVGRLP